MFWGLIMEAGKRYTQTVERAFHLSMAVLELDPSEDDDSVVSLRLHFDNREFILCHLNREKMFQVQLDLNFQSGDKIAFLTSGRGRVHLSGYLLETDEDEIDDMDEDDEEDESISEQMRAMLASTPGKRKSSPKAPKQTKKLKLAEASDEDDSDEDAEEEDDEDDDSEVGSDDEDEAADIEEDDDEDEDEEESSEEEMMVTSPKQKTPEIKKKEKVKMSAEKQQPNRTPGDKQQQQQLLQKKKTPNEKQQQQQNKMKSPGEKPQTPVSPATPNGLQESGKKKKKKGQQQQDTPKPETPQRRTLEGGVIIEDLKVGTGPVAKPGRQVQVYYVGRLKQNNKQFDSSTEGPGFKFRLARGEVIKGWDIGVSGMRVGGKRKIVCPPALAYGNKGSPPSIPPNSALVFEVELKSVN